MPRLTLGPLNRVRPQYQHESHNIFASIDRSSLPSSLPEERKAVSSPPPPPDPFLVDAKKIQYLGYAKAGDLATAFLAVGKEVLVISETEVFGGRFRLKEVKDNSVIVSSLDGRREVRLGALHMQITPTPKRR